MKYYGILLLMMLACGTAKESQRDIESWERWKVERMAELKSPDGFVNLAGLFWLEEGTTSFGSDSSNKAVFPADMPPFIGEFARSGDQVTFSSQSPEVMVDSMDFEAGMVFDPDKELVSVMAWGSYMWYVIKRTDDIGIRLKNLDHPMLSKKIDIKFFEHNPDLVVDARFVPYPQTKELRIENVFGHQFDMGIRGQLRFELDGKSYTLEPMDEGDKFFIIFSDETSAIETYGSGRYLYADMPMDGQDVVRLDFNRAKNPPCAFTDFATCLIPPPENRLNRRIEAGELDYHMH